MPFSNGLPRVRLFSNGLINEVSPFANGPTPDSQFTKGVCIHMAFNSRAAGGGSGRSHCSFLFRISLVAWFGNSKKQLGLEMFFFYKRRLCELFHIIIPCGAGLCYLVKSADLLTPITTLSINIVNQILRLHP